MSAPIDLDALLRDVVRALDDAVEHPDDADPMDELAAKLGLSPVELLIVAQLELQDRVRSGDPEAETLAVRLANLKDMENNDGA